MTKQEKKYYVELRNKLEREKKARQRQIAVRLIALSLILSGTGYGIYKNSGNKKDNNINTSSNQVTTIRNSSDITEFTYDINEEHVETMNDKEIEESEPFYLYGVRYESKEETQKVLSENHVIIDEVTGENILHINDDGSSYITCEDHDKSYTLK